MSSVVKLSGLAIAIAISCARTHSAGRSAEGESGSDSQGARTLRWLDAADPQRDLSKALARGDQRFIGVYGYTSVVPGVGRSTALRHGVRYLRGTSDALESREHARLNRLAYEYARRYNELLRERLKR